MTIALIAAVAGQKMIIGKDGDLPWHFPSDLKFFKEKTKGHPVVMGGVTYQSILKRLGKPLPDRQNIVVTRDRNFTDDRVTLIHDINDLKKYASLEQTLFVIGGARIYADTIGMADTLYLTHIDNDIDGDARFPSFSLSAWALSDETRLTENDTLLRFCTYQRRTL